MNDSIVLPVGAVKHTGLSRTRASWNGWSGFIDRVGPCLFRKGPQRKCDVLIGAWGKRIPVCGVLFLLGDGEASCIFVWALAEADPCLYWRHLLGYANPNHAPVLRMLSLSLINTGSIPIIAPYLQKWSTHRTGVNQAYLG